MRSETSYAQLPNSAIERMGMAPGQKNVLVLVVLRHLERTLTDSEATNCATESTPPFVEAVVTSGPLRGRDPGRAS